MPKASRGWDNAKKVNGRKRHIAVDTTGLLLEILATPASVQDRDAARPLLFNLHRARRRVRRAWADSVYAGKLQPWAATYLHLTVEIVKRPADQHTFEVLPRRWVVERTLAWITSYRRCARDYERLPAHHEAAVYWAMITLMTRRLARPAEVQKQPLSPGRRIRRQVNRPQLPHPVLQHRQPPVQPIRSAITVAGIVGYTCSNSRIRARPHPATPPACAHTSAARYSRPPPAPCSSTSQTERSP